MIVVAYAIALLLPLGFLYLVRIQDLYGQGQFKYVLLSFGWGLVAFGLAYGVNSLAFEAMGSTRAAETTLRTTVAPITEEILKSLILIALARRMTYFVDGAIYGFAAGIAFSILENVLYLTRATGGSAGAQMLARAFSTCLMHGSASALVGIAIGRFRYGHGASRLLSALLGWAAAIGLHMAFNRLVNARLSPVTVAGTLALGLGGVVLIVVFIRWGLAQEKRWITETLGSGSGVTRGEVAVVRQYDRIDDLLEPIVERFGEEKADQVEEFLLKQAHLGIKRKMQTMSQDPAEQDRLGQQIAALHQEMEAIRRKVGVYCMTYVRTIFPEDAVTWWSLLERSVTEQGLQEWGGPSLQASLAGRANKERAAGDMWARLGQVGE
jgi:RsiW-degrading membrane proteinase PrsW (M82 family)